MTSLGDTPRTLAILNNKGGIGKTTTAVNLAAGLARAGNAVLLVDLDSQASASLSLGMTRDDLSPSTAEVLFGNCPIEEAILPLDPEPVDILPASLELADADVRLFEAGDRHHRLAHVLEDVQPLYDFILLDCPPSTSLVTLNAMIAADAVIIPVSPAYLALEGIVQLGRVIKQTRSMLAEPTPVLGLVLTMVDRRADSMDAVTEKVRDHYGEKVFTTEIRTDSTLSKAAEAGQSVFAHDPESSGAEDYAALTKEVITRVDQYRVVPSTPPTSSD